MERWTRDWWSAAQALRRNRGFSLTAIVLFGLGIAANATVFGWVRNVLLAPLPGTHEPERLVILEARGADGNRLRQLTHPDFRDYQRQLTTVSGLTASQLAYFSAGPPDAARRVLGQTVSANYFAVLGVRPFLGRVFTPAEDRDNRGAYPLAVVSHRFWADYFQGNRAVIGQAFRINGRNYTLVGVTEPAFRGSMGGVSIDIWVPLSEIVETGNLNTWAAGDRNARFLEALARLKPGVTIAQAREEVRVVAARLAAAYPDTHRNVGAQLYPFAESEIGLQAVIGDPLRILMLAGLLVMLIACANVANLLVARSIRRQQEYAIRTALGATGWELAVGLVREVLLLSAGGALLGLLLSQWLGETMMRLLPPLTPTLENALAPVITAPPGPVVILFTALLAAAAALLAVLVPAVHASGAGLGPAISRGGRSGATGHSAQRLRNLLVIGEVALATLAVAGSGLALRAFDRLRHAPLGFRTDGILVAQLHLSANGFKVDREKQFGEELRRRLAAGAGIEAVSSTNNLPVSAFSGLTNRVQGFGNEWEQQGPLRVGYGAVAPGYFDLLGIPLLAGRDFNAGDDRKHEGVIIVNETFARKYLRTEAPIGRRLRVSGNDVRVIGVVKDSKYVRQGEGATPHFYGAFAQMFWSGHNHFLLIRARDLEAARKALQREIGTLLPAGALVETTPLAAQVEAGMTGERVAAGLLSALAALALLLAGAGLYSVMVFHVSERTREIGIRMALGAARTQVLAVFVGRGLKMTLAGLGLGAGAAWAASRLLPQLLAPLEQNLDSLVVVCGALALLIPALLSSLGPAWRASQVNPTTALRAE